MHEPTTMPDKFWNDLDQRFVAKTVDMLNTSDRMREPVIADLREVEAMARAEVGRRSTIQITASARRVLGNRSIIGSANAPSPRSTAATS